jgi:hypothetical protein
MIRIVLGSVLPLLAVGAAATLLSPDLLTAPRGKPLVMASSGTSSVQAARYNGDACASSLLLAGPTHPHAPKQTNLQIMAFAVPTSGNDLAVAVEDFPRVPALPRIVVLVFDEAGRLVSAGGPGSLGIETAESLAECINPPEHDQKPV